MVANAQGENGKGGSWSITTKIDSGTGIFITNVMTATVEEISSAAVYLNLKVRQTANTGSALTLPGVPAGTLCKLKEFSGTGSGTAAIKLSTYVPIESSLDVTVRQVTEIKAGRETAITETVMRNFVAASVVGPKAKNKP